MHMNGAININRDGVACAIYLWFRVSRCEGNNNPNIVIECLFQTRDSTYPKLSQLRATIL